MITSKYTLFNLPPVFGVKCKNLAQITTNVYKIEIKNNKFKWNVNKLSDKC